MSAASPFAPRRPLTTHWLVAAVVLFLGGAGIHAATTASTASAFENANRQYEEGKYREAAAAYEAIIQSNHLSPAVLFNLGNACFKAGQLGQAITAYRRAEQLAPRDPDIQANLQFARSQVQGTKLSASPAQRWLGRLTLNEWTLLASCSFWLLFLLLALRWWRPTLKPVLRKVVIPLALLAIGLCACLGFALQQARSTRIAIVLAPETNVHFGPLEESPTAFTAHDGAELRVLDQKDQWLRVSTGAARNGWLQRDKVALIGG